MGCGFLHCVSICIENYPGSGITGSLPRLIGYPATCWLLKSPLNPSCTAVPSAEEQPNPAPWAFYYIEFYLYLLYYYFRSFVALLLSAVLHECSECGVMPAWQPCHGFNQLSRLKERLCTAQKCFHPAILLMDTAEGLPVSVLHWGVCWCAWYWECRASLRQCLSTECDPWIRCGRSGGSTDLWVPSSRLWALAEGGMGGVRAADKVREALLLSHRVQEGPLAF